MQSADAMWRYCKPLRLGQQWTNQAFRQLAWCHFDANGGNTGGEQSKNESRENKAPALATGSSYVLQSADLIQTTQERTQEKQAMHPESSKGELNLFQKGTVFAGSITPASSSLYPCVISWRRSPGNSASARSRMALTDAVMAVSCWGCSCGAMSICAGVCGCWARD